MNAGAFKMNISDNLLWVRYLKDGKEVTKDINELYFSYRSSELKEENIIVLEAAFKIITDKEVMFIYKNILEKRRNRHPLNYPNCGSIFKNLEKKRAYEVIKDIYLDDYSIGGAKFSEKHANFIVNYNKAKASDIYKLIILAKKRALILEDVTLKEEVILLNFPSYKLMFKKPKK
jgi:UDP-N-acetylmuramate dehydrogenase